MRSQIPVKTRFRTRMPRSGAQKLGFRRMPTNAPRGERKTSRMEFTKLGGGPLSMTVEACSGVPMATSALLGGAMVTSASPERKAPGFS